MRDPAPTVPNIRPSDPHALQGQQLFWNELGSESVYVIGSPRDEEGETVTPIDIVCQRSLASEYDVPLDVLINFVSWKDFTIGEVVSSIHLVSGSVPPASIPRTLRVPLTGKSTPPPPPSRRTDAAAKTKLSFPFRRLEVLPDHDGRLRRLWVGRAVPNLAEPPYAKEYFCLCIWFFMNTDIPARLIMPRK